MDARGKVIPGVPPFEVWDPWLKKWARKTFNPANTIDTAIVAEAEERLGEKLRV